jgi:hypothetical protein
LQDFNPEATTFDHLNGYYFTVAENDGVESLIAINMTNGAIEFSTSMSNQEIFAVEMFQANTANIIEASSNENKLNVFPNPSSDICHIEIPGGFNHLGKVQIFDLLGNIIQSVEFQNKSSYSIDLKNINPGKYIVKLISDAGTFQASLVKF